MVKAGRRDLEFNRCMAFNLSRKHGRACARGHQRISLLVGYLIDRYAQEAGNKFRNIGVQTMELFHAHDWPGNIRDLKNVVQRSGFRAAA
jgi:transcriptional regulator of aromatic amino acid metabolism